MWLAADTARWFGANAAEHEPAVEFDDGAARLACTALFQVVRAAEEGAASSLKLRKLCVNGDEVAVSDDNPAFANAARAFLCAALCVTQCVHHAWWAHGAVSGNFVYAAMTALPPAHPLRRLLAMTECGALKINELGAESLFASTHNTFAEVMNMTDKGAEQLARRAQREFHLRDRIELPRALEATHGLGAGADLSPSTFCRTLFRIERTALHSYGPDPHPC